MCRFLVLVLFVLFLAAIPGGLRAETADACGFVERRQGACLVFHAYTEPSEWVLPDSVQIANPDFCHVHGEIAPNPITCGGFTDPYLTDVQVSVCVPESLGCGILRRFGDDEYDNCLVWEWLRGHGYYLLDSTAGFALGDTTLLLGIPITAGSPVPGTCADYGFPVAGALLYACHKHVVPIASSTWGRIKSRYRE